MRLALLKLVLLAATSLASCAQPPLRELSMVAERVEAARVQEAPLFASELFAEAELSLQKAERILSEGRAYGAAIRALAVASLRADEAFFRAVTERRLVLQRLERTVLELESLLSMVEARGADTKAASELAAFRTRYEEVRALAGERDLVAALHVATDLKEELLGFELRIRD